MIPATSPGTGISVGRQHYDKRNGFTAPAAYADGADKMIPICSAMLISRRSGSQLHRRVYGDFMTRRPNGSERGRRPGRCIFVMASVLILREPGDAAGAHDGRYSRPPPISHDHIGNFLTG